jgi:hypothetical protein
MVTAMVAVRLMHWFEERMGWKAGLNPETTQAVLGTLAGAMFTFIVFVCSSLLLVVQLASAQFTPRALGTMFRDPVTKLTLAVFVFSFTFVLAALLRIGSFVPLLITEVAVTGCAVSLGVFLYLIDHVGKMLRPSGGGPGSSGHRTNLSAATDGGSGKGSGTGRVLRCEARPHGPEQGGGGRARLRHPGPRGDRRPS